MAQLTQKERMILEEEKSQEQLCVEKYSHGAEQAECSELKQLFNTLGSQEEQHLNTINSILNGQTPMMGQGGGGQQGGGQQMQPPNIGAQGQSQGASGMKAKGSKKDAMLCHDALATEKFVSGLYNTGIFEFRDTNIRQTLNHIQKEEQQHGEQLFNYMSSHGYYQVQ